MSLNLRHTKQDDVNCCINNSSFHLHIMTTPFGLCKHKQKNVMSKFREIRAGSKKIFIVKDCMSEMRPCSSKDRKSGSD
jgi:hypothetical protein